MNHQFDEFTKGMAQPVTRRGALKKFGLGLTGMALACFGSIQQLDAQTSAVYDRVGDAVFPYNLYDGPVPPYLDVGKASVTLTRGGFHFEIKVSTTIPANGDPGLNPPVNHLGSTFGIQTDRHTADHFNFFGQQGQQGNYYFNYLVGAMYVAQDAGVGMGLGWHGFLLGPNGITEIPLVIRGDTYIFETSAASLGNPAFFKWAVGSECDPVPIQGEKNKTVLVVDYVPDHGYASWPLQP